MRISLNGRDWHFKDFYGEDWRWRNSHKPQGRDTRGWRKDASVPGSVLDDLWRLGEIENPYAGRNSLLCEWVPERTWVYKRAFTVPKAARDLQRARLVFEGVDYEAEFFLNGEPLGRRRGMFTPATFEVGELLRYGGENLIAVVIEAAPHEEPQVGRTSRVRTHKARMNYWWDFCPRLVHQGIWRDVYLELSGPVRIAVVAVRSDPDATFTRADVGLAIELDSALETEAETSIELRHEGQVVTGTVGRTDLTWGQNRIRAHLHVEQPRLWWPNGSGEQALYHCEVRVSLPARPLEGEAAWAGSFGIRRIELAPNDTPDASARPYTLVVNGRRVYVNGWNWAPIDALYGVPRAAKLERLLVLARDANVNLLRVWGGGLIEGERFYDLCDRLGIMVWQEFILSSSGIDNSPSTDADYIAMLVGEAEQIIPLRRNHPSLAVWCGGNELQGVPGMLSAPDVSRGVERPLDDSHPALAALRETVERLDPGRPWLPTSPTGRAFGNSLENIAADPLGQHDVHGPWEYQGVTRHYELCNAGTSLFHSEFGVEGITNPRALDAVLPRERQWPVDLDRNRDWFHLGAWWVRRAAWDHAFGPLPDVAAYVRATQFTQSEGLRYAIEADRRRQWRNSGVIPWQFNEPYPMAACTSAVDYWAEPKPAYYAVARAYAPLSVTAAFPTIAWEGRDRFEATVWAASAGGAGNRTSARGTLTARLIGGSGRVYLHEERTALWAAGAAANLAGVSHPLSSVAEDFFFLDLYLEGPEGTAAANRYVFARGGNLAALVMPQLRSELTVDCSTADTLWRLRIRNAGSAAALFVWLEDARERGGAGWAYFDDNYFCLFPGEERMVTATWSGVGAEERKLSVVGWNTDRIDV